MYRPKQFIEDRQDVLLDAIREIQLAALVTPHAEGIEVTHVPVVITEDGGQLVLGRRRGLGGHGCCGGRGSFGRDIPTVAASELVGGGGWVPSRRIVRPPTEKRAAIEGSRSSTRSTRSTSSRGRRL